MAERQVIAFVGLGAMGSAMAATLLKKQYHVRGYDIAPAAVARLVEAGGEAASSVADCARQADVLIVMTVNIEQAEDVVLAQGGLDALKPGGAVVLMSTCAPARVAQLASRVTASGRAFIDAPVSGGVVGARDGALSIMAAAPMADFERAKPVLAAMGSGLVHVGEQPGQGAAMKIVNQLLCGVHIAVAAEGLAFAERQGIDPALALEILSGSAASSWMLKNRGPRMVSDDAMVASAVDIFVKDLGLVLDAGRSAKMGLPLAALAHQSFLAASGMGLGGKDDSQVIAAYRALGKTPAA